jgi:hypothetical protein
MPARNQKTWVLFENWSGSAAHEKPAPERAKNPPQRAAPMSKTARESSGMKTT